MPFKAKHISCSAKALSKKELFMPPIIANRKLSRSGPTGEYLSITYKITLSLKLLVIYWLDKDLEITFLSKEQSKKYSNITLLFSFSLRSFPSRKAHFFHRKTSAKKSFFMPPIIANRKLSRSCPATITFQLPME